MLGIIVAEKSEINNLDRLYTALATSDVKFIDLKSVLLNAKSAGRLYYKKDTHWTNIGAEIAFEAIMDKLNAAYTNIDVTNYSVELTKRGDLDKLLYPLENRYDEEFVIDSGLDYDSFVFLNPTAAAMSPE